MAWHITGIDLGPCSCDIGCPCILGEMEGDRGWCSAVRLYDIHSGEVDGIDVSGTKVALVADWPSGFLAGNGTGRLYFDPSVSQEQRDALEAVISGQRGGVFEVIGSLIPNFLPSKEAPIDIEAGDEQTRATVADVGELVVTPLVGPQGKMSLGFCTGPPHFATISFWRTAGAPASMTPRCESGRAGAMASR